ncbi:hypothetical protein EAS62_01320 [Bradyrhizobium zhanjiangense]|uniref:DUF982 domain-containing protein n=1 Tax=Bradyrhizobium zhanjiangense TaxID=1325107 RepID=A0ABY0DW14_9BRAD|nr:hypothetical protein EAS62_01320 [Bradyrhizobium zhanjiangense]
MQQLVYLNLPFAADQGVRSRARSFHRHCEELLRRSNPDCLRGKTLDCFAALAMTEFVATRRATPPAPSFPCRDRICPRSRCLPARAW